MKKGIILAGLAFFAFTFTACKKDWTCECIASDDSGNSINLESFGGTKNISDANKSDAETLCDDHQKSVKDDVSSIAPSAKVKCDLKAKD